MALLSIGRQGVRAAVDSPEAAALLVKAINQVADEAPVIMPVHPRGRAVFEAAGLAEHSGKDG